MIPYKINEIKNLEDVKAKYPVFNIRDLKDIRVKKFIKEELETLVNEEIDNCEFADLPLPSSAELGIRYKAMSEAKGLYRFYWCCDHIFDQLAKLQYKPKDAGVIILRMQAKGLDPYSVTDDTVGHFIESLPNRGYKLVKTRDGREFLCYDPRGYHEKQEAIDVDDINIEQ